MGNPLILLFVITFTLTSCSYTNEHKMKSSIEEYLEENAKDPKSYEFISLTMIDTITAVEHYGILIVDCGSKIWNAESWIEYYKSRIELDKLIFDTDDSLYKNYREEQENKIKEYESKIKEYKSEIELYESKITQLGHKEVFEYVAIHKYRIKNGFGALDLFESKVVFDAEFNVKTHSND